MKVRFAEHRKQQKLSQEDLAAKMGISQNYLSNLETGRRPVKGEHLIAASRALRVPVLDLVEESSDLVEIILSLVPELDETSRRPVLDFILFEMSKRGGGRAPS